MEEKVEFFLFLSFLFSFLPPLDRRAKTEKKARSFKRAFSFSQPPSFLNAPDALPGDGADGVVVVGAEDELLERQQQQPEDSADVVDGSEEVQGPTDTTAHRSGLLQHRVLLRQLQRRIAPGCGCALDLLQQQERYGKLPSARKTEGVSSSFLSFSSDGCLSFLPRKAHASSAAQANACHQRVPLPLLRRYFCPFIPADLPRSKRSALLQERIGPPKPRTGWNETKLF